MKILPVHQCPDREWMNVEKYVYGKLQQHSMVREKGHLKDNHAAPAQVFELLIAIVSFPVQGERRD